MKYQNYIIGLVFLCACSPQQIVYKTELSPVEHLHFEISSILSDPAFSNAFWGVAIQSLQTGEIICAQNAAKGFLPASNMKLLITAAVLVELGPDFTYQTPVLTNGKITENSVLDGDLIIQGRGDPSIGRRIDEIKQNDVLFGVFKNWAERLKAKGISQINGDIVGDDNYFDDQPLGNGWAWDDEDEWYAAQLSALSLNDNCIVLKISPADSVGKIANVKWVPDTDYVQIINAIKTVGDSVIRPISVKRQRGSNKIHLDGEIPFGHAEVDEYATIENPTLFFITVLKEVLEDAGIRISGSVIDIDDQPKNSIRDTTTTLFYHDSEPLANLINVINKNSQNLWAELVFRTLGAGKKGPGSHANSQAVIHSLLSRIGINPDWIDVADGSGLSRQNLMTPLQMITLLRFMYRHPDFQCFYESLPIAGVDGTMKDRLTGTAAAGNVRAKTGSLNRVKALSGYVTSKDQEDFVFSLMINNYTVPSSMATDAQDLICERLANFSRK